MQPDDKRSVAARLYTFDQLADIYNQARVDYIVPMPMNGKRMGEYIHHYDIDMDASVVAINADNLECGVGMLGIREDRSWITRLGVVPQRRGHKIGQYLMEKMLNVARERQMRLAQLEVIVGNEPAHKLFLKLGFEPTRELLVIRRPPGKPEANAEFDSWKMTPLEEALIPETLATREPGASWVEETPSLLNAGNLRGFTLETPTGDKGWLVFQRSPFQLTHFVLSPGVDEKMAEALLYTVHREHAMQDTKLENLPTTDPFWPVFQKIGYFEVFRRTEMFLYFHKETPAE
ncbi:MAG: hypothetical protein OHK0046_21300 [Anaerolineae bacterium]